MTSESRQSPSTTISVMFLVAGCCIGGGMLALPLATGVNGFIPSLALMAVCWLFMTLSALMLVEANLWMEEGAHVSTMTARLLGRGATAVAWLLYFFIAYGSLMAYTAGAGHQLAASVSAATGMPLSSEGGALLFLALFTAVIAVGSRFVGSVNSWLFIAMLLAYGAMLVIGLDEVHPSLLAYERWNGLVTAVPMLLTSFSFQTMVPSLTPMLGGDVRRLRRAIVGGTTMALLVYGVWQALILGIVPVEGEGGLRAALEQGVPPTVFLRQHVGGKYIVLVAEFFAFFAIATSFLGIGLGLWDFLADGLSLRHRWGSKGLLALLLAVPTIVFVYKFERIFYIALDATGGFGDTVLNGIFPALMLWKGRYRLGMAGPRCLPGGKLLVAATLLFFSASLAVEVLAQLGWLSPSREAYDVLLELSDPSAPPQGL